MGAWPLSMVATKWLDNVNALFVCIYVYALSTLTYSLNIFRKKDVQKERLGHTSAELGWVGQKKKIDKATGWRLIFYSDQKIQFRPSQNKWIPVKSINFGPFYHI